MMELKNVVPNGLMFKKIDKRPKIEIEKVILSKIKYSLRSVKKIINKLE